MNCRVSAVAERLVLRGAAAAQGHAVAHFVRVSVRARDRNSAAQPYRPRTGVGGIFDETDRRLILRLDRLTGLVIPGHEPSGRTIAGLLREHLARGRSVGLIDEIPDLAMRITKARERA